MSAHDDVVLQVGNVVKDLGTVCADLDSSYHGQHGFGPKFVLPEVPREFLSAFVPTQAVFTPRVALTNPDWKEPDLAVKQHGFAYILDVFDDNDTNTSISRKIETVIVNSAKCKIVGVAIIAKGINRPYQRQLAKLKRLRETFHLLFGGASAPWGEDDMRTYLQPLFAADAIRRRYGDILWERVLTLNVAEDKWAERLRSHVAAALTSQQMMTRPLANAT